MAELEPVSGPHSLRRTSTRLSQSSYSCKFIIKLQFTISFEYHAAMNYIPYKYLVYSSSNKINPIKIMSMHLEYDLMLYYKYIKDTLAFQYFILKLN